MRQEPYVIHNMRKGFITLVSVLIAGAVAVALAASLILLGLDSSRTSFALSQSYKAKGLANACVEEALEKIRESTPFAGTGGLTLGDGTCSYTVVNLGGQNRSITALGTVSSFVRKMAVSLDKISPVINITSWAEVADF